MKNWYLPKLYIFLLIAIIPIIFSCMSKQEKMIKFVNEFNNSTSDFRNKKPMKSLKAYYIDENTIRIEIESKISPDELSKKLYSTLYPTIIKSLLVSIKSAKALLDIGVVFKYDLLDKANKSISNGYFDKNNINSDGFEDIGLTSSNQDVSIQNIVTMLNKDLPIRDSVNKITIWKIELNPNNTITYVTEFEDIILKIIKILPEIKNDLKKDFIKDENLSESLKGIFQFGIDSVYYVLIDKNKKRVDSIVFTPDDFHIINLNKIQKTNSSH